MERVVAVGLLGPNVQAAGAAGRRCIGLDVVHALQRDCVKARRRSLAAYVSHVSQKCAGDFSAHDCSVWRGEESRQKAVRTVVSRRHSDLELALTDTLHGYRSANTEPRRPKGNPRVKWAVNWCHRDLSNLVRTAPLLS